MDESKKIKWFNLAFMAFSGVWGFGNTVNGFAEYGGMKAIVSWLIIFAIYFVPYTLMVGELGSAFKDKGGGISGWIKETINPKIAYYAGWVYWVVNLPYISQKPQGCMIAATWLFTGTNAISSFDPKILQIMCLGIFILALWISTYGVPAIEKISTLAGSSMFVMSILFVIMMIAAPAITGGTFNKIDWSMDSIMPNFDMQYFFNLSILVFSVGGCELISPYVNKMKNPSKEFPKGMFTLALMVAISAILGTVALAMMFDGSRPPADLMTNGAYYAFQKLGQYYGVGNTFLILYALTNLIGQASVLIVSIDAPLRILLESSGEEFIPKALFKQNKHGAFINGHKLIFVIVSILIIVPAFGLKNVNTLVVWLIKLNSVCIPLSYLCVFVAYIALKRAGDKFHSEYKFCKNNKIGLLVGIWCFGFTAFACILGMIDKDPFKLMLNVVTPVVLVGLGFIMPKIAAKTNKKAE